MFNFKINFLKAFVQQWTEDYHGIMKTNELFGNRKMVDEIRSYILSYYAGTSAVDEAAKVLY